MSAGIRAGSSNDGYVQVNGNDIITALSSGNVGIGNTSPSTKLHVNGTVTATKFIGGFDGNSNISVDDWIVHTSDTDTKLGFPAADQIQFDTGGTNYLKLHRYSSVNFVEVGSAAHLSFAANGSGSRNILIGDGNASSTGKILIQAGGGSSGFGGGITLYSHANTTNPGGIYIGRSVNSSGSIILGHGGTAPSHEYLKITSTGKSLFKSQGANAVWISLLDNDSSNEIWRVGQAADGDGYVEVLEDGGTVGCKLDASGNSFTMGNFGVGVASPGVKLTVGGAALFGSSNTSKNIDGCLIERNSSDGLVHIAACRTGGNFSGLNFYVAGDVGGSGANIKLRHAIDYQGNFSWYDADGSALRMKIRENGNVGIGSRTSNPSSLLHVHTGSGDAVVTVEGAADAWLSLKSHGGDSQIRFGDASSGSAGQIRFDHGTDNLFFEKGGSQRGKIASDGSTTWGPSSAGASNMQWTKDTNQIPHFFWGGPAGSGQPTDGCVVVGSPQTDICSQRVGTILFGSTTSGGSGNTGLKSGINCVTNASPGSDFNAGGNLIFQTKPNNATLAERLRMTANGEVLIGRYAWGSSSRPNDINKLVVTGTSPADTYDSQLYLEGSETSGANSTGGALAFGGHDGSSHRNWCNIYGMKENGTGGNTASYMSFHTRHNGNNPAEKLRITSTGTLLAAGNTSYDGTTYNFHQMNVSQAYAWTLSLRNTTSGYGIRIKTHSNSSGREGLFIYDTANSASVGAIYMNGTYASKNSTYGGFSDIKLKENIVDAKSQWDDIKALKVRNFNFKKDPDEKMLGLIAQEAEIVCPSLVINQPDKEEDADGNMKETGEVTKQLKYSILYMKAVKCLQEAQARIETLESKVAALESS